MAIGHFVWTDLSTYDMRVACKDYSTFFGWQLQNDSAYSFAHLVGQEIAALFPMPSRLADMNMPSFWMSYVHVENVEDAVSKALTQLSLLYSQYACSLWMLKYRN